MSEVFERFLSRLNAQGREKAEGFFPDEVTGLTPDERMQARGLLTDALRRGDTTAVHGLVLLDGDGANAPLENAVRSLPFDNDVRLSAAHRLWEVTRDPQYQAVMLEYLKHPSASTRLVALGFLQRTPSRPSAAPELARVVESDEDVNNRAFAGELLLSWLGVIPKLEDSYRLQREFMRAVEGDDLATRRAALDRLRLPRAA